MLFGLLLTLYIFCTFLLALIILIQKGKSSTGLMHLGGGSQLLFGGSGGQDLFQKITWALGVIFMGGSLLLSLMKTKEYQKSRYFSGQANNHLELPQSQETPHIPAPELPNTSLPSETN